MKALIYRGINFSTPSISVFVGSQFSASTWWDCNSNNFSHFSGLFSFKRRQRSGNRLVYMGWGSSKFLIETCRKHVENRMVDKFAFHVVSIVVQIVFAVELTLLPRSTVNLHSLFAWLMLSWQIRLQVAHPQRSHSVCLLSWSSCWKWERDSNQFRSCLHQSVFII